ncbi:hypothetical protein OFD71_35020, partial [Escherichia coli]|nr:hypothetical protein [Escherichia coli]
MKVIDREYAGIADPRLDVTLTIQDANGPVDEAVKQYCQLRGIEDVSLWMRGVHAWQPRTLVMAMLWYLLAYKLWGD